MSRRFAIVYNEESGPVREQGAEDLRQKLEQGFDEQGIKQELHPTTGDSLIETLESIRDGNSHDAVIIAGGDGSVAAAAKVFLRTGIPVGVLPLGTMNLAARDFGVPLDLDDAIAALAGAEPRDIDVLTLDDRVMLCNMILGFYPAQALREPEYHGKLWVMKIFQTVRDTLLAFSRYHPLRVTLQTDTGEITCRTRFVTVTANRYENLFGLFPRHETLDGGYLTVYLSEHDSFWSLARSSLAFIFGRLQTNTDLKIFEIHDLRIDSNRAYLPVMLDGEVIPTEPPLQPKLEKQALKVLLPRRAAGA